MTEFRWDDLVLELDEALSLLRGLGLHAEVAASRFQAFRIQLARLAELEGQRGVGAALSCLEQDHQFGGDVLGAAITESAELLQMAPYLATLPKTEALLSKVRIALRGQPRRSDDDQNSSEGRNTMLELNMAARLHRAHISAEIGPDADLDFTFNGIRWFGECKRPYAVESIERNLDQACDQLARRFKATNLSTRGVLVVSVARPLESRVSSFEYASNHTLRESLKVHVGRMVVLVEHRLRSLVTRGVSDRLGLLVVQLAMPGWDATTRSPSVVQYAAGTDLTRDGSEDGKRLWLAVDGTFSR